MQVLLQHGAAASLAFQACSLLAEAHTCAFLLAAGQSKYLEAYRYGARSQLSSS